MYEAIKELDHYTDILREVQMQLEKMKLKHSIESTSITVIFLISLWNAIYLLLMKTYVQIVHIWSNNDFKSCFANAWAFLVQDIIIQTNYVSSLTLIEFNFFISKLKVAVEFWFLLSFRASSNSTKQF